MRTEAAWAAFARADWASARSLFAEALEDDPEDPDALDGLGQSLWWLAERGAAIEWRTRAFAGYRRRGDALPAARLAIYLAGEHRIDGEPAAANGWLARARRLLDGLDPAPEHGWLEVEQAKRAGDPARAAVHAEAAIALARELGDADVEVMALGQLGCALVSQGRVDEGARPARRGDGGRDGRRGVRPPRDLRHLLHDARRLRPAGRLPARVGVVPARRRVHRPPALHAAADVVPRDLRGRPDDHRRVGAGRAGARARAARTPTARRAASRSPGSPRCASGRAASRRPTSCSPAATATPRRSPRS